LVAWTKMGPFMRMLDLLIFPAYYLTLHNKDS